MGQALLERFSIALKESPLKNGTVLNPVGSRSSFKLHLPLGFSFAVPLQEFRDIYLNTPSSDYGKMWDN